MLRRIFFKKSNKPIKLGRWGTSLKNENDDNSSQNLYLQTDLSNHDHCGSDICGAPSNSKSYKSSNSTFFVGKKKLSSKKNLSISSSNILNNIENNEEYFYPFLIGSWHVNYKK